MHFSCAALCRIHVFLEWILFLHSEVAAGELVHDQSDGTIACHVRGRAEAVESDVRREHEPNLGLAESKHLHEQASGGRDGAAGNAGSGDHHDPKHQDERQICREGHVTAGEQQYCDGKAGDLHHGTG